MLLFLHWSFCSHKIHGPLVLLNLSFVAFFKHITRDGEGQGTSIVSLGGEANDTPEFPTW